MGKIKGWTKGNGDYWYHTNGKRVSILLEEGSGYAVLLEDRHKLMTIRKVRTKIEAKQSAVDYMRGHPNG